MEQDHNIEQLFQRSETSKAITPPTHVWDRIDGKLQNKKITKRVSLYKYVAIAAIGVCLFAVYFTIDKTSSSSYSASYFVEDLTAYDLHDKSDIDYFTHRKLIGTYTDQYSNRSIF